MSLFPTHTTVKIKSTTIADNATTSSEVDLENGTLCGIFIPAGFVGTALTFTAAPESGGTFVALENSSGNAISYTVEASKYYPLDPKDFWGVRWVKFVSGSSETGGPLTIKYAVRVFE